MGRLEQRPGGMFLLRSDGMPDADRHLLSAVARVVLRGDLGELAPQLDRTRRRGCRRRRRSRDRRAAVAAASRPTPRADSARWSWRTASAASRPTAANTSIVARRRSRDAAAVVERAGEPGVRHDGQRVGLGVHVGRNSRENRLTPFANDPVTDPTGEAIYLRDEESGAVWGATPGPLPRAAGCRPLGGSPCRGRDALSARRRRARAGADGRRRAGRSGEGLRC